MPFSKLMRQCLTDADVYNKNKGLLGEVNPLILQIRPML